ncbi:ribonuclease III [Coriobacteriales bacterium OH1046]|nr:ribonuclease III [Coriobacteriales bacterium OH1046]
MSMHGRLSRIEAICGHHFKDRELVSSALTHPSAVEGMRTSASYERLEFLGDAILGALVSSYLYGHFDEMDEGGLTRLKISLVSGRMLSDVAEELGIAPLIIVGDSERGTGARGMHSALENVYEALVGALFLDGGIEASRAFVERTLIVRVTPELAKRPLSPKSLLQQCTQKDLKCAPAYQLVGQSGPAHNPLFTSEVSVCDKVEGTGSGATKKESEEHAAQDALVRLGYIAIDDDERSDVS